jgi:hypothetical protein
MFLKEVIAVNRECEEGYEKKIKILLISSLVIGIGLLCRCTIISIEIENNPPKALCITHPTSGNAPLAVRVGCINNLQI